MRLMGIVDKGWGHENIFASTDLYCGKILEFKTNAKCSMHYHKLKDETWYVLDGMFRLTYINTETAEDQTKILNPGDTWHNPPLLPHQLECLYSGRILEVSTADSVEDNYRIRPGDSQTL